MRYCNTAITAANSVFRPCKDFQMPCKRQMSDALVFFDSGNQVVHLLLYFTTVSFLQFFLLEMWCVRRGSFLHPFSVGGARAGTVLGANMFGCDGPLEQQFLEQSGED